MLTESKEKESLVDFLGLEKLELSQGYTYRNIVRFILIHQYGIPDQISVFEDQKFELESSLSFSQDFNKHFFSTIAEGEKKDERIKKAIESFKRRIQSASLEEIMQASLQITEKIEKNDPDTFYETAIDVYYGLMKSIEKSSYSGHFFSTQVNPLIKSNNGFLSIKELIPLLSRDKFMGALFDLPRQQQTKILNNKDLTTQDIDALIQELIGMDNKRRELHKKILDYAKGHFQKDYLDVYIDIIGRERLPTEGYNHLYSPQKGYLSFNIGLLDLSSSGSSFTEFSRAFGEEYNDEWGKDSVKRGYDALKEAREEAYIWNKPRYESRIKKGRLEEEDNHILDQIQSTFRDYIFFKGDYLFKNMHGHYIFGKLIVFDTNKIRANLKNPENKIDEIKEYIISLLPKPQE